MSCTESAEDPRNYHTLLAKSYPPSRQRGGALPPDKVVLLSGKSCANLAAPHSDGADDETANRTPSAWMISLPWCAVCYARRE